MDGMITPRRGGARIGRRPQPSLAGRLGSHSKAAPVSPIAPAPNSEPNSVTTSKTTLSNFKPLTPGTLALKQETERVAQATRQAEADPLLDWPEGNSKGAGSTMPAPEDIAPPGDTGAGKPPEPPKQSHAWRHPFHWFKSLSKKGKALVIIVLVIILAGIGTGAFFLLHHKTKPVQKQATKTEQKPAEPEKPTTVPSTLTGLPVDPAVNNRNLIGVMIENSTDARPQSGLDQAGVVFEAIAEGGITRFLALFQDQQPDYLGPVRSVRPYYIQWASGFDAPIAHVGGSPEALQYMKDWNMKDLDQFTGGTYFDRITSRYAPHNVYTSYDRLSEYETKLKYSSSKFTGFARKDSTAAATPTVKSIDLALSGASFNVHYDYDASTNSYKRSEGGAVHNVVNATGQQTQLAPKVVVALVMPYSIQSDGIHSEYQTIGSGSGKVFQNGTATDITWHKASRTSQFTFTDSTGKPFALANGQTWVTAVGDAAKITSAP